MFFFSPSTGAVPQVFLTAPPGTVQIPVSAVQLHPVRQDLHFTSETLIFSMQPACHVTTLMHPNSALAHKRPQGCDLSLLCMNVNNQPAHAIDLTKHNCSIAWKSKAWMILFIFLFTLFTLKCSLMKNIGRNSFMLIVLKNIVIFDYMQLEKIM